MRYPVVPTGRKDGWSLLPIPSSRSSSVDHTTNRSNNQTLQKFRTQTPSFQFSNTSKIRNWFDFRAPYGPKRKTQKHSWISWGRDNQNHNTSLTLHVIGGDFGLCSQHRFFIFLFSISHLHSHHSIQWEQLRLILGQILRCPFELPCVCGCCHFGHVSSGAPFLL